MKVPSWGKGADPSGFNDIKKAEPRVFDLRTHLSPVTHRAARDVLKIRQHA